MFSMTIKRLGFRTLPLLGLTILGTGCAALLGLDEFSEGSDTSSSASSSSGGTSGTGGSEGTSSTSGIGGTGGGPICEPATQTVCESGLPGACAAGMQTCLPDGMSYTTCVPNVAPSSAAEDCTKIGDEDCDGIACSDCVWSFLAGDANTELPRAMAIDPAGNTYVTGTFDGTLKLLDKSSNTSVTLNTAGNRDIFLAKFSPKGDVLWAKSFGDPTDIDLGNAVAVDAAGNVFIAGGFSGTADFGGGVLTASSTADIFVAKFDPTGGPLWSKRFGSSGGVAGYDQASAIAVDPNGDVVLGGTLVGKVTFDGTMLPTTVGSDVFVAKLAGKTGAVVWVKQFKEQSGTTNVDQSLERLATDSSGNIFLAGQFQGNIFFTAFPGKLTTTGGGGDWDAFVAKLDTNGNASWGQAFGSSIDFDDAVDIAVDSVSDVVVTGYVSGDTNFGGGVVSAPVGGVRHGFLVKYTNIGGVVKGKILPVSRGYSIDVGPADDIYVAGTLSATGDLGGGALPFGGGTDTFLARFDANLGHGWSKSFGDNGTQVPSAVRYDESTKNVVLAGYDSGNVDFGTGLLTGKSATTYDLALAKFQP
jgi:hypothetical protein